MNRETTVGIHTEGGRYREIITEIEEVEKKPSVKEAKTVQLKIKISPRKESTLIATALSPFFIPEPKP